jgi:DNA polymerase-3 subunit alpha
MGNPDDKVMHLIVYARNLAGYYKLIDLNNAAWGNSVKGMFGNYKGTLTLRHLEELGAKNLICQTACMAGPASRAVIKGEDVAATYNALNKHFDYTFLELQDHKMPDEKLIMQKIAQVAIERDLPVVMCTDIHYLNADQKEAHSIYMAMQFKKTVSTMDTKERGVGYHVMEREEMELFDFDKKLLQKGLDNTLEIASMIDTIRIKDIGAEMPKFKFPVSLDQLVYSALKKKGLSEEYRVRAEHELQVVKKLGFEDYFLAVHDYVNYAHMNNVLIGPGRGSAAGSLVNYLLEITQIDPLAYDLSFERFLNEGRVKTSFSETQFI